MEKGETVLGIATNPLCHSNGSNAEAVAGVEHRLVNESVICRWVFACY